MPTETEARYLVPDRVLFKKLRKLESLAGYALRQRASVRIVDHYLDTPGKALLRQGWACRLRSEDGTWTLTLKAPKEVHGAILERLEYEIPLPERIEDATRWPPGEIRERVLQLSGGSPLRELVSIHQRRHRFAVVREAAELAELCLDVVRVSAEGMRHRIYMLECELLQAGTPADLERIDDALQSQFYLTPEPRSKLQRALELIGTHRAAERTGYPRKEMPMEALAQRYDLNLARAQRAASNAEELFGALQPLHGLPDAHRRLVSAAAWLSDIGRTTDRKRRHLVGRDILLQTPPAGFCPEEQRVLAAAVCLHRGEVTTARLEEALPEPDERTRRQGLLVAALVRLAAALGGRGDKATRIKRVEVESGEARVELQGPRAARDATRAQRRSDLWSMLLDEPLDWQPRKAEGSQPTTPAFRDVGLEPSDTMREAGRKVLTFHFEAILRNEAGTREGADPEALHDMRVAVRRMRSALRVFARYLIGERVAAVTGGLRETTRALGDVRDMDVALGKVHAFVETLPGETDSLFCLLGAWETRRAEHRQRLITYLDSAGFDDLVDNTHRLLEDQLAPSSHSEDGRPATVLAPLYLRVEHNVVAAYESVISEAPIALLHALRIDCKRLRYGFEFFLELLPTPPVDLVRETVALQDHLGEMHDADVAVTMLDAFLAQWSAPADPASVRAYRATCLAERDRWFEALPEAYARFRRPEVQGAFAQALGISKAGEA